MSTALPSSCPSCQHPLSLYQGRCARCGALLEDSGSGLELDLGGDSGLELDLDRGPSRGRQGLDRDALPVRAPQWSPPSSSPTPPVRKATPPVSVPVGRGAAAPVEAVEPVVAPRPGAARKLFAVGVLALVGTGAVLLTQGLLPARFPPLLTMLVWVPALTGAPSDFFAPSAWVLSLLPWGLFALALAVGHRLSLWARVPMEQGLVEWLALALVPGVHLVGGPLVLGELGSSAESLEPGLRLRLKVRTVAAVALDVLSVSFGIQAAREPGEVLFVAALALRVLSVAAFAGVLFGVGRALRVLARGSEAPVTTGGKGRGWGSAARRGGSRGPLVTAAWAVALGVCVVAVPLVWFIRSEARTCESGTALRSTQGAGGRWVGACVLPDGRRQGRAQTRAWDGRLLESGEYRQGQRHGTFRMWSERGVLLEESSYAEGQPDGRWKLYRADGQRALEMGYAGGQLSGESTTYYANGNPRYRKNYQRGVVHGRHARWFESGLVEVEGAFNQGRPSGWWVQRNAEGKVVKQWSEGGLSADEETAGVSAVFMGDATLASSRVMGPSDVVELRAGHTREWWQKRLGELKIEAGRDSESAALYQLTLRRARANGFVVFEKTEGVELALEPVH
ncbi:hypothetical protein JQX13_12460 [Archangium violaceum]|uniref:hypothetical protein n=1 Tax=Archangium violaceum TaxID=83451 RepID=UPI00193BFFC1|nr:hypothetical protein [Archangium violaceum]QRK10804.1 hypothetical protein JQX13_12460 [Archangium violaceum]